MEIDSGVNKGGWMSRAWEWFKGLPSNLKAKVINVGKSIKQLGKDDPRRVSHSLKVGLALTLVSLLYYSRTLFDGFGAAGMWAVLTVVVVFEFTVGGTLCKSLNRGFATLVAGALGVGVEQLASLFGQKGEPIVIGFFVFLLAAAATFSRFNPRIKARYDYGVLIFILTFSLVAVSGIRVEEIIVLAHQRLSTIIVGGATCIVISRCICPVWAGQDLHNLVSNNIDNLANYLLGFGGEYFPSKADGENIIKISDDNNNKHKSLLIKGYKSVLNSKSTEDTMANLARWEPRHGKFRFRHPWNQYLKIGSLSRQCAYHLEALNACISTHLQVPEELLHKIEEPCTKISEESGKALKSLSSSIKTMTDPSPAKIHVENAKNAVIELKVAMKCRSLEHTDLLAIVPAATVASTLIQIAKCVDNLFESVTELSNLAHFKAVEPTVSPEKPQLLHRGVINPVFEGDDDQVVITINESPTDSLEKHNVQAPNNPNTRQN